MSKMEIPYVPKTAINKADDAARVDMTKTRRVNVADAAAPQADGVSFSSKARLMSSLRSQYDKLETPAEKITTLKDQATNSTLKMSSEDIVNGILRGTMFGII
jgi:anti-sigma28 factor (negative regulator of flagellin synthesis)